VKTKTLASKPVRTSKRPSAVRAARSTRPLSNKPSSTKLAPRAQANGKARPALKPAPKVVVKAATKPSKVTAKSAAQPANIPVDADLPIIHVNGQMLPKSKAMVSVYDHGLLYGDGIFEGIRVYQGKIFKCKQHMDRLYHCADQIRLKIPVSRDRMVEIQRECIKANNATDGYIRLVVTRGFGTLGLDPRRCPTAGVICIMDQIRLFPKEAYEAGMRVIVARRPKTPIACLDPRIKSLNYLNNILAKCEAIDFGCDEVIMLNLNGEVTEGSGDNIFIVKDGQLYTPPSDAGILEGVTRGFVMRDLAPMFALNCTQKTLTLEDVLTADEVFLTGTAAEIIGVTQIDQHDGKGNITKSTRISSSEGPITKTLRLKFREIATGKNVPEE
jgi:branched-chain amino acid aminotransferase